jgi:hypothetical protein
LYQWGWCKIKRCRGRYRFNRVYVDLRGGGAKGAVKDVPDFLCFLLRGRQWFNGLGVLRGYGPGYLAGQQDYKFTKSWMWSLSTAGQGKSTNTELSRQWGWNVSGDGLWCRWCNWKELRTSNSDGMVKCEL